MQGTLKGDTVFLSKQSQYINQSTFGRTLYQEIKDNSASFSKQFCFCCKNRCGRKKPVLEADPLSATTSSSSSLLTQNGAIEDTNPEAPLLSKGNLHSSSRPLATKGDASKKKLGFLRKITVMRRKKKGTTQGNEAEEEDEDDEVYQLRDDQLENDDALSEDYEEPVIKSKFGSMNSKKKQASINFYSYEFEKIMKGKKGEKLIKYLSDQHLDSPLF
jgi:hypothetical protein